MATSNLYLQLSYQLSTIDPEDGVETPMEEMSAERPLTFVSGLGAMLEAFEAAVTAVAEGETFDFTIPCAQAFGPVREGLITMMPKSDFEVNGRFDSQRIYEGAVVPMQDTDGRNFCAVILEVEDDEVTLDLNHPYAGMDLHYVGRMLTNRPATPEEMTQMVRLLAGEGGCGGCGGQCHEGCGGCA